MKAEVCKTCKFWREVSEQPATGLCVCESPRIISVTSEGVQSGWPMSREDGWCGKFEAKK